MRKRKRERKIHRSIVASITTNGNRSYFCFFIWIFQGAIDRDRSDKNRASMTSNHSSSSGSSSSSTNPAQMGEERLMVCDDCYALFHLRTTKKETLFTILEIFVNPLCDLAIVIIQLGCGSCASPNQYKRREMYSSVFQKIFIFRRWP